ncbi:hypothetical protein NDU88_005590 [Pleurodeles waltl]|uniref:Uncharacterized protein n=1 Tax=Pleurodeles waltl TaxID=8319 RepID=A0AAV7LXR0_PLEWA|nr:hypothetical protein NDU88_005590 [Pleurodeles waltl]
MLRAGGSAAGFTSTTAAGRLAWTGAAGLVPVSTTAPVVGPEVGPRGYRPGWGGQERLHTLARESAAISTSGPETGPRARLLLGAIGGPTSTDPRVWAPAAAPALDSMCGLPGSRIYIHNCSREACVDEHCCTSARFNECTRGRPGGRAAVTLLRLVGTGAAPHFRPRFGAAVLDEAAPLLKQYSTDRGLMPRPTAHSSYHPLDKLRH